MDRKLVESRLQQRINRKFKLNEEGVEPMEFWIDNFSIKGNTVTVFSDLGPIDFTNLDECNSWLNSLKEIEGAVKTKRPPKKQSLAPTESPRQVPTETQAHTVISYQPKIGSEVLSKTADIVFKNIEKLQGDNGIAYIEQAQEINSQVKSIISLARTEMELILILKQ